MRSLQLGSLLFSTLIVLAAAGLRPAHANLLVNGGFETDAPCPDAGRRGNNIGHPIPPWILQSGTTNVVCVDGPGGYDYRSGGPESDARGEGEWQHYLDIANGAGVFYQPFEAPATGQVVFGGFVSTRDNRPGSGSVALHEGAGTSGRVLARVDRSLPAGSSKTDPWVRLQGTASVREGTTYSLVVSIDNNANFDEGFVQLTEGSADEEDCPPWSGRIMEPGFVYQGPGGITSPFTLVFESTDEIDAGMQAWLNRRGFAGLSIELNLHDAGTGPDPVPRPEVLDGPYTVTWRRGRTGPIDFLQLLLRRDHGARAVVPNSDADRVHR